MSKQVALKDVSFHFKCKCGAERKEKTITLPLTCSCGATLIGRPPNNPLGLIPEENQFANLADQIERMSKVSSAKFDFSLSV
jgi:hypothetical protein